MDQEPSIVEIGTICKDDNSATKFVEKFGLVISNETLCNLRRPVGTCALGTVNCAGLPYHTTRWVSSRGKAYDQIRCNRCKKGRSTKNTITNGVVGLQRRKTSFFAQLGTDGKNHTKLPYATALQIMWCWSKELSITSTAAMMQFTGSQETLVDWFNHCRELCLRELNNTPPMGGPGQVVQMDEVLLSGYRKSNRGRHLVGDRIKNAEENHAGRVEGPWVFGLVCRRDDGKLDLRLFHILRRDVDTIRPIVQKHVRPGSTIWSDCWTAYGGVNTWGNYQHETVNISRHFVNPADGVNLQRIKTCWRPLKTKILRQMCGSNLQLLPSHLAAHWWLKLNREKPFVSLLAAIGRQFPIV